MGIVEGERRGEGEDNGVGYRHHRCGLDWIAQQRVIPGYQNLKDLIKNPKSLIAPPPPPRASVV